MRLTPQTINTAGSVLDPDGRLTLLLRKMQIPYIENLGVTNGRFELIDLTDNEIVSLGNIPSTYTNLKVLLLANNYISFIDDNLLPDNRIVSLSLANNHICRFLLHFAKFKRLEVLILTGNPITKMEFYRQFCVWLIPSLKILDYNQIKMSEREDAVSKFGPSVQDASPLALSILNQDSDCAEENVKVSTNDSVLVDADDALVSEVARKLTETERDTLVSRLKNATTLEAVESIEQSLRSGMMSAKNKNY